MIDLPTTSDKLPNDQAGSRKPPYTGREYEDIPPAYSRAPTSTPESPIPNPSPIPSPSRVMSLSRNRQAAAPFSAPINGLQMYTKRESIRGCWTFDPLAPLVPEQNRVQMFLDGTKEKKRGWCRSRSAKTKPPTAMLTSRHGNIEAMLRVVGESALRSVATINTVTRSGDIVIDLVSIAPMRTVHIDAKSRRGTITLLVPRNFCGLVELSSRHGAVELLPVLAASGRVIKTMKKKTTVLLGDGSMPAVGADIITDTARMYSRHGRVRLGFSGEDHVAKVPGLLDHAMQLMQKFIGPSQSLRKTLESAHRHLC